VLAVEEPGGAVRLVRLFAHQDAKQAASVEVMKTRRPVAVGEVAFVGTEDDIPHALIHVDHVLQPVLSEAGLYDDTPPTGLLGRLITIQKAAPINPLTPGGFDRATASLASIVRRATGPLEKAAIDKWISGLGIRWTEATDAQLAAVGRSLNQAIQGVSWPAWDSVKNVLKVSAQRTATATRRALVGDHDWPISMSLSRPDRAAIERSVATNAHYIRDYYGKVAPSASEEMRRIVEAGLEDGRGSYEIGKRIKAGVGRQVGAVGDSYYNIVANAVTGRSRSFSQLGSFRDAGIAYYIYDAVLDEVTTPTCFVAGTPVATASGVQPIEAIEPGDLVHTAASGLSRVRATSARFTDELVSVKTSSGRHLTVTAEHPILSSHGWTKAGNLRIDSEIAVGKLRALREGVHLQVARREVDKVLLSTVLPRIQDKQDLGGTNLCPLRKEVSGKASLCGARTVPMLLQQMQEGRQSQRCRPEAVSACLQGMRAGVYDFAGRVPGRKGETPLFQGVSAQADVHQLRVLREGNRDPSFREAPPQILFQDLLSQVQASISSRAVDIGDTERLRDRVRGGEAVWGWGGQKENRTRGFLAEQSRCGAGVRRGVLARREAQRQSGEAQVQVCRCGWWACGSCPVGRHQGQPREIAVEDYLASTAGLDRVVSISRRAVRDVPVFNLEMEGDDPTYIANGLVVHNCAFLHGKRLAVDVGLARFAAADALQDPTDIRYEMPWTTERVIKDGDDAGKRGIYIPSREGPQLMAVIERRRSGKDDIGEYSRGMGPRQLENAHIGPPPLHGR